MESGQPIPAALGRGKLFGRSSLEKDVFSRPPLHILLEAQPQGGQMSESLRNGELRVGVETRLPSACHELINVGAIRDVDLADQVMPSALRPKSNCEGAPLPPVPPEYLDESLLEPAPAPLGAAELVQLVAKLNQVEDGLQGNHVIQIKHAAGRSSHAVSFTLS